MINEDYLVKCQMFALLTVANSKISLINWMGNVMILFHKSELVSSHSSGSVSVSSEMIHIFMMGTCYQVIYTHFPEK